MPAVRICLVEVEGPQIAAEAVELEADKSKFYETVIDGVADMASPVATRFEPSERAGRVLALRR